MSKIFWSQNITKSTEQMWTINVQSTSSTNINVVNGMLTLGPYSYNRSSGNVYYWTIELTELNIFGLPGLQPDVVTLTIKQGIGSLANTKDVSVTKDNYEYTVNMDGVVLYSCSVSGTTRAKDGSILDSVTIREDAPPVGSDYVTAFSTIDGDYTWSGRLTKGIHTITANKVGYQSVSNSFNVNTELQTITSNFVLVPTGELPPTGTCTITCTNPSKSAYLVLAPRYSGISSPVVLMGRATQGTGFRYVLTLDDNFFSGLECVIYDRDNTLLTYGYVTLRTNGIVYFTM